MTVQFSPTSTLHCFYKPQDDISRSWYSSEDEQRFKQQAKEDMISCLRMKIRPDDSAHKVCPVGLELKLISRDFCHKRLLAKELVRLAVRVEQEHTIYDNDYDRQERIASASMKHSEWSRSQAETLGTFQAMAAQAQEDWVTDLVHIVYTFVVEILVDSNHRQFSNPSLVNFGIV